MTKTLAITMLAAFSTQFGHCQTPAPKAFEVASIKPCEPGTRENPGLHMGMVQFTSPGGRFNATAISVKYLLEWAYGIQAAQHTGGPSWIDSEFYDITAKAAGPATDAEIKLMVQSLLA